MKIDYALLFTLLDTITMCTRIFNSPKIELETNPIQVEEIIAKSNLVTGRNMGWKEPLDIYITLEKQARYGLTDKELVKIRNGIRKRNLPKISIDSNGNQNIKVLSPL